MVYFLTSSYVLFLLVVCSSFSIGFVLKDAVLRFRAVKSLSSTNIPNDPRRSIPPVYYGLLSGLPNALLANYYSMNVPMKQAAELVKHNRHLYDIIEAECQSDEGKIDKRLEEIENEMDKFMEKNKVWDRKDLLRALDDVTRKKGNFVCLLGGKSTGKSLVLEDFSMQKKTKRTIIYVDMRSDYASITYGFLSVISKGKNTIWKKVYTVLEEFIKNGLASKLKVTDQFEVGFNSFLKSVETEPRPNELLESLIEEIIHKLPGEVITLVIDEANLPLTITDCTTAADRKDMIATLALFTKLTKQKQKVGKFLKLIICLVITYNICI